MQFKERHGFLSTYLGEYERESAREAGSQAYTGWVQSTPTYTAAVCVCGYCVQAYFEFSFGYLLSAISKSVLLRDVNTQRKGWDMKDKLLMPLLLPRRALFL